MFEWVPTRAWLLILIGMFVVPAGIYVCRHLSASPSDFDVTKPKPDLEWRSSRSLAISTAAIVIGIALAIFIFTPAAERFARSPQFLPLLMIALTGWMIYFTADGIFKGQVEPVNRGATLGPYNRIDHPIRYWLSLLWNLTWCGLMTFLIFKI